MDDKKIVKYKMTKKDIITDASNQGAGARPRGGFAECLKRY